MTTTIRSRGQESVARRLAASVGIRDPYTAGHSHRVQRIALEIGAELELPREELGPLAYAALFHDIGKLTVPDAILMKPSSLSPDEWTLMRRHSSAGAELIEMVGLFQAAVPAIRHHHERYDGGGYPDGLAGEEIPIAARVIHVADAVDSMLSNRIYRAGRPARQALAEVREATGSQFCPRCAAALRRAVSAGRLADMGIPSRALVAPERGTAPSVTPAFGFSRA